MYEALALPRCRVILAVPLLLRKADSGSRPTRN
jgi:hypothetical protein